MSPRPDFILQRAVNGVTDYDNDLKVTISDGKLVLRVKGEEFVVDLPEDAYTLHAKARYDHRQLTVTVPRRDPKGEAMLEMKLLSPERKPRELDIEFPTVPPSVRHRDTREVKPPAVAELEEGNTDLLGEPAHKYAGLPDGSMKRSVATDNPVVVDQGGAFETPSQGETVVRVPRQAGTRVTPDELHRGKEDEQLAQRMRGLGVVGGHTQVLQGMREQELDEEYGHPDEDVHQEPEHIRVDFTKEKVGLATRPLEARDAYVTSESRDQGEVLSSMKQGDELCDLCECNPCQCDKVDASRTPFELSKQEQKRMGKPHLKTVKKPVTGVNSHDKHDYRMHAKPRDEHHAGVGTRMIEFEGNVPKGAGDWEDYTPDKYHRTDNKKGSAHTGGQEIHLEEGHISALG